MLLPKATGVLLLAVGVAGVEQLVELLGVADSFFLQLSINVATKATRANVKNNFFIFIVFMLDV